MSTFFQETCNSAISRVPALAGPPVLSFLTEIEMDCLVYNIEKLVRQGLVRCRTRKGRECAAQGTLGHWLLIDGRGFGTLMR